MMWSVRPTVVLYPASQLLCFQRVLLYQNTMSVCKLSSIANASNYPQGMSKIFISALWVYLIWLKPICVKWLLVGLRRMFVILRPKIKAGCGLGRYVGARMARIIVFVDTAGQYIVYMFWKEWAIRGEAFLWGRLTGRPPYWFQRLLVTLLCNWGLQSFVGLLRLFRS